MQFHSILMICSVRWQLYWFTHPTPFPSDGASYANYASLLHIIMGLELNALHEFVSSLIVTCFNTQNSQ